MLVINFDFSSVVRAAWILVAERGGGLTYSMVTVENVYVPDWPAGSSLSKYTMLMARRTEVHETNDNYSSVISLQSFQITTRLPLTGLTLALSQLEFGI